MEDGCQVQLGLVLSQVSCVSRWCCFEFVPFYSIVCVEIKCVYAVLEAIRSDAKQSKLDVIENLRKVSTAGKVRERLLSGWPF